MDKKDQDRFFNKYNLKWVFLISIWTFFLALGISLVTENLVKNLDIVAAIIVLIVIILIGIIFDIIGIAVTTADEKPFHAMAANRVQEAKYAIKLVRNAGQVSNFCNDVIGDISGILSGAAATTIIFKLARRYPGMETTMVTIVFTSLIAALTVGGKAFGKSLAMLHYERIIYNISKVLNLLERKLGIDLLPNKKKNKK